MKEHVEQLSHDTDSDSEDKSTINIVREESKTPVQEESKTPVRSSSRTVGKTYKYELLVVFHFVIFYVGI